MSISNIFSKYGLEDGAKKPNNTGLDNIFSKYKTEEKAPVKDLAPDLIPDPTPKPTPTLKNTKSYISGIYGGSDSYLYTGKPNENNPQEMANYERFKQEAPDTLYKLRAGSLSTAYNFGAGVADLTGKTAKGASTLKDVVKGGIQQIASDDFDEIKRKGKNAVLNAGILATKALSIAEDSILAGLSKTQGGNFLEEFARNRSEKSLLDEASDYMTGKKADTNWAKIKDQLATDSVLDTKLKQFGTYAEKQAEINRSVRRGEKTAVGWEEETMADRLIEGVGGLVPFAGSGLVIKSVAQMMRLGSLAPAFANMANVGIESAIEMNGVIEENKANGMDEDKAIEAGLRTFGANMAVIGISNKLDGIFDEDTYRGLKRIYAIGQAGAGEGMQEGLQQIISNYNTDKPLMEGVGESFLLGAIIGSGAKTVFGFEVRTQADKDKAIEQLPDNKNIPEDKKEIVLKVLQGTATESDKIQILKDEIRDQNVADEYSPANNPEIRAGVVADVKELQAQGFAVDEIINTVQRGLNITRDEAVNMVNEGIIESEQSSEDRSIFATAREEAENAKYAGMMSDTELDIKKQLERLTDEDKATYKKLGDEARQAKADLDNLVGDEKREPATLKYNTAIEKIVKFEGEVKDRLDKQEAPIEKVTKPSENKEVKVEVDTKDFDSMDIQDSVRLKKLVSSGFGQEAVGFGESADVYSSNGKPVIAVSYWDDKPNLIAGFSVAKEYRGKGVATEFMKKILREQGGKIRVISPNAEMMKVLNKIGDVSEPDGEDTVTVTEKSTARKEEKEEVQQKDVRTMKVADIKLDPKRFQYKVKDKEASGATGSIDKDVKYSAELAGVISVWRDPSDGQVYVVNGHNRFNKALESKIDEIPVMMLQNMTAEEARATGALQNIADNKGTIADASKYFRDTKTTAQDLKEKGISIGKGFAEKAVSIANLSDFIFDKFINEKISPETAYQIGQIENENIQFQVYEIIRSREEAGYEIKPSVLREIVENANNTVVTTEKTESLFGETETDKADILSRAEVLSFVKENLTKDKNVFAGAVRNKEMLERGNNSIDPETSKKISDETKAVLGYFDVLKNSNKEIVELIKNGVSEMQDKSTKERKQIKQNIYENIKSIIPTIIEKEQGKGAGSDTKIPSDDKGGSDNVAPKFKLIDPEAPNLTLKTLEKLKGRESVSKQFISDLTNASDIKQTEKDVIRATIENFGDKINVAEFKQAVQAQLLPLTVQSSLGTGMEKYENISLADNEKGRVKDYFENVYESGIKNDAGEIHWDGDAVRSYFGHTRLEDMADNITRRLIEVQSDLYQRGRLENVEALKYDTITDYKYEDGSLTKKEIKNPARRLLQYNNPTAHFRMFREEVAKASADGMKRLLVPTGETAMKIEGLGQSGEAFSVKVGNEYAPNGLTEELLSSGKVKVGSSILKQDGEWVITEILGDVRFKAVQKEWLKNKLETFGVEELEGMDAVSYMRNQAPADFDRFTETFDISGKVDKNNPIYKFYEKELGRYVTNNYGAKPFTDEKGVTWLEVPIKPEYSETVLAFKDKATTQREREADDQRGLDFLADYKKRFNLDFDVYLVNGILGDYAYDPFSKKKTPMEAWGVTYDNAIAIAKRASKYTAEHEVVHFTLANLDKIAYFKDRGITKDVLLKEQAKAMGLPENMYKATQVEEELAINFERYVEAKNENYDKISKTFSPKSKIAQFFEYLKVQLVKLGNAIVKTKGDIIMDFYDDLYYARDVKRETERIENKGNMARQISNGIMDAVNLPEDDTDVAFKSNEIYETNEDRLIKEAQEYKTLEDFVKAKTDDLLFHGTIEDIEGELRSGGDSVFWTAKNPAIAQNYIPKTGGGTYYSVSASDWKTQREIVPDSSFNKEIYRVLGIDPAIVTIDKMDYMGRATSYSVPEGFELPTYDDFNKKLREMGYTEDDKLVNEDGGKIVPKEYKKLGSLFMVKNKNDLNLYDMRDQDFGGEEQYNQLGLFKRLAKAGYDGVIINDIAQSKTLGNVGHTSYGLFGNALKKMSIDSIDARNNDWETSEDFTKQTTTEEFEQYKKDVASAYKKSKAGVKPKFKLIDKDDYYLLRNTKQAYDEAIKKLKETKAVLDEKKDRMAELAEIVKGKKTELDENKARKLSKYQTKTGKLSERGLEAIALLGYEGNQGEQEAIKDYQKYLEDTVKLKIAMQNVGVARKDLATLRADSETLRVEARRIEKKLRTNKQRTADIYTGIEKGLREGQKEAIYKAKKRKDAIVTIQKMLGLKDEELKAITVNKDGDQIRRKRFDEVTLVSMSDEAFRELMDDMVETANNKTEKESLREAIQSMIYIKQLSNYENLRLNMELPPFTQMNKPQLYAFFKVLEDAQFGDRFLTTKQLDTVHRTDFAGIQTIRELFEKLGDMGVNVEDLEDVKFDADIIEMTNGNLLKDKNPMFKWLIDKRIEKRISSIRGIENFRKEFEPILKKARSSRPKGLVDRLVPTDELVFNHIENNTDGSELTKDEKALAEFIRNKFAEVYAYLHSEYNTDKRSNYITHIRRGFLEAFKNDGIGSALREMWKQKEADTEAFNILAGMTGDIVPYEKFFGYALRRTGEITPSNDIAKIMMAYISAFEKKVAIDKFAPEALMMVSAFNEVAGYTEQKLPVNPLVGKVVKEMINSERGRHIKWLTTQGSVPDTMLTWLNGFTRLKVLGFDLIKNVITFVGDYSATLSNMVLDGSIFKATKRTVLNPKLSQAVNREYGFLFEENPFDKLKQADRDITSKLMDIAMLGFAVSSYTSNMFFLRGKLTEEEFKTGIISDKRIAEIANDLSKRKLNNLYIKSLAGETTIGKSALLFGSWAMPMLTTIINDVEGLAKAYKVGKWSPDNKAQAKDLASIAMSGLILYYIATLVVKAFGDDDRDYDNILPIDASYRDKIIYKLNQELNTVGGVFSYLYDQGNYFIGIQMLGDFTKLLEQLFTLERYKEAGAGHEVGDLKAGYTAWKFFTPNALRQMQTEITENPKIYLMREAVERGEIDAKDYLRRTSKEYNDKTPQERIKAEKKVEAVFKLRQKYGFNNSVVNILLSSKNNDEKAQALFKAYGIDQTKVMELKRDGLISDDLFKDYKKLK